MCGIAGVIGNPLPSRRELERMRDVMAHRGPDDAGTWIGPGAALVHRRLAVIDPGPAGHQPMCSPDGRFVLAYNGELYNDAELRDELDGAWATTCDTETLLRWLAQRRPLARLRGMYALAFVDTRERTLTLARDPLGIKPLFWAHLPGRVAFASEIQALLAHPDLTPEPDPLGVSLYLSSVRTTMRRQTLFAGVHAVEPGEALTFSLDAPCRDPAVNRIEIEACNAEPTDEGLRDTIIESVHAHLRSDRALCAMLSGGLDSTIIVGSAREELHELLTYCAGADADEGDPDHAAAVARTFSTTHHTALLDEPTFGSLWLDTIDRTGLPLATPNEVAIRLIARTMKRDGQVVALSGEGADELFAGYEGPLSAASTCTDSPGRHELESNAWVPAEIKPLLLVGSLAKASEDESVIVELYESAFERAGGGPGPEARLRFQRAVNLPMLLQRLDSATMLESVEGRTPFADARVASAAAAIPIERLFDPSGSTPATRTKLALRAALRDRVPRGVLERTKASFPVPFERWMASGVAAARSSRVAQSIVQPALLAALLEDPQRHWNLAWPVLNLVLWAERWWGEGLAQANAASTLGTAESSRFV